MKYTWRKVTEATMVLECHYNTNDQGEAENRFAQMVADFHMGFSKEFDISAGRELESRFGGYTGTMYIERNDEREEQQKRRIEESLEGYGHE